MIVKLSLFLMMGPTELWAEDAVVVDQVVTQAAVPAVVNEPDSKPTQHFIPLSSDRVKGLYLLGGIFPEDTKILREDGVKGLSFECQADSEVSYCVGVREGGESFEGRLVKEVGGAVPAARQPAQEAEAAQPKGKAALPENRPKRRIQFF